MGLVFSTANDYDRAAKEGEKNTDTILNFLSVCDIGAHHLDSFTPNIQQASRARNGMTACSPESCQG